MATEGDADEGVTDPVAERQTAPQGDYTRMDVVRGAVIAGLGIVLTFVVPLLVI